MNTCATCDYWYREDGRALGKCHKVDFVPSDDKAREVTIDVNTGPLLAYLYTGPQFGCVHHQPLLPPAKTISR